MSDEKKKTQQTETENDIRIQFTEDARTNAKIKVVGVGGGGGNAVNRMIAAGVEGVRAGAHGSVAVEPHRAVELFKPAWDARALEALAAAAAAPASAGADLVVVLLEPGAADVLALTPSLTLPQW